MIPVHNDYYILEFEEEHKARSMSLINQTAWVVGGVGVIGRGMNRTFLLSLEDYLIKFNADEDKNINHTFESLMEVCMRK